MTFEHLIESFEALGDREAIAGSATYAELERLIRRKLRCTSIPTGSVVTLVGDYTLETIACQLALQAKGCIVVPVGPTWSSRVDHVAELTQSQFIVEAGIVQHLDSMSDHPLYEELRKRGNPGLVLLTSGTTGESKVVVHNAATMLKKVAKPGRLHRTLAFLSYDHIGGQNTMLYCLAHGGCLVTAENRTPDMICEAIERHKAELLPTSPSFLRMLLLSGAIERHNLSSLELITYGSEPMPESTLESLNRALPQVAKMQQFGMSELGVLRSRSRGNHSTWIKLGGPEFQVRVINGHLQVKAETAMLGYLNAPSPFTEDDWLETGDVAEQDGEWIRILGRDSDVINVGGEKVHPAEVESVIEKMEGVASAVVYKTPNPILGNVVAVRVRLAGEEQPDTFRKRLRAHCTAQLPRHMVPQKIEISQHDFAGVKKSRAA